MAGLNRRSEVIKQKALELGFDLVGITAAVPPPGAGRLKEWVERGLHGGMEWMARDPSRRLDPSLLFPGARSVVCVAKNFFSSAQPQSADTPLVARHARGMDYHRIMEGLLKQLLAFIRSEGSDGRYYVDWGPLLEKPLAGQAGLGWLGRNTILLSPRFGPWLLLGEVVLDQELDYDHPHPNYCGRCRRCLDACPSGALALPGLLDARRCISFWTIESRGWIPDWIREMIGFRVFGCDTCLQACPWHRFSRSTGHIYPDVDSDRSTDTLAGWMALDQSGFDSRFRRSAIKRLTRAGLRRNLCLVLGNRRDEDSVGLLAGALADPSPLVRGHAAWALGRLGTPGRAALEKAAAGESDPIVAGEIELALERG